MDDYCDSIDIVASRLFRSEHKPKFPAYRKLDPHPGRYRPDTHHLEPPRFDLTQPTQGSVSAAEGCQSLAPLATNCDGGE